MKEQVVLTLLHYIHIFLLTQLKITSSHHLNNLIIHGVIILPLILQKCKYHENFPIQTYLHLQKSLTCH